MQSFHFAKFHPKIRNKKTKNLEKALCAKKEYWWSSNLVYWAPSITLTFFEGLQAHPHCVQCWSGCASGHSASASLRSGHVTQVGQSHSVTLRSNTGKPQGTCHHSDSRPATRPSSSSCHPEPWNFLKSCTVYAPGSSSPLRIPRAHFHPSGKSLSCLSIPGLVSVTCWGRTLTDLTDKGRKTQKPSKCQRIRKQHHKP